MNDNQLVTDSNVESANFARLIKILDQNLVKGSTTGGAMVNGLPQETRYVLVTPDLAEILLIFNTNNRKLKNEKRNLYVKEMLAGNWKFDAAPIRFSYDGILRDGGHRLSAIFMSGKSYVFKVETGLEPESFHTMDINGIRTVADTAYVAGIKHSTVVGSVVRAVYALDAQKWSRNKGSSRTLTNTEFINVYNLDAKNYDASTTFGVMLQKKAEVKIMSAAELATFHYKFTQLDSELALDFITNCYLGDNLVKNSPIYLLRNLLLKEKTDKNFSLKGEERTKAIVYAWNLVRTNTTVKTKTLIVPETFDGIPV